MRTTLDLQDALVRTAKKRAADDGKTLTAVIEEALRQYLAPASPRGKPFRLRLLTKKGRPVPGVNFADRDALYERMEGRA
ncbi:MAG: type II toxin-antitoxin system VapB family antitoxin [Candidatus Rokuibacteriota bacterium]